MRVTNSMIFGNSMNNIWRNARHLNRLVTQLETGKRIHRPSDDPLLSSRALRYRTILSEAEQFLRNVQQGMAWMEVSEAAFNSVLTGSPAQPSLMQRMYTRLVEAAQTGTNTLEDQRAILAELRQYFNQMFGVDMNQTYLGRYVFSGFHTDQPPVLKTDWQGRSFLISQEFIPSDMERTIAFHFPSPTEMVQDIYVNVLKLPFTEVNFHFDTDTVVGNTPEVGITLADGTRLHVITLDSFSANAYRPEDFHTDGSPIIHHLHDTGELVMSDAVRELFEAAGGISIVYEKSNIRAGELNPIIYFETTEITGGEAVRFGIEPQQNIQMEVSPNAYVTINSHARNILTANLFSDLRRLFDFADSLVPSDPRVIQEYFSGPNHLLTDDDLYNAVQNHLSDEQAKFSAAMHDRINNMIKTIMLHSAQAQREHTNLGSRMSRLEMIGIRLEEDEVAYAALLSENEDTDLSATIMRKSGAEAAFNNALRAIAITTQLSLADFINR
jgi:flagellar hook-associated protein 3 FlgL